MSEVVGVEAVEPARGDLRVLHDRLQQFALVGEPLLAERRSIGRRRSYVGLLALLPITTAALTCPADLRTYVVDVDPDRRGDLARERVDLRSVADRRDESGSLRRRVDPLVGAVEVVLAGDVGEYEAVQRHPLGDQLTYGSVTLLQPEIARVETLALDRDVRLGNKLLVALEGAHRGVLAGFVAVEGEDDLATELVMVEHQSAQNARVVGAERRATRRDRGRHTGLVAGHHIGVTLDDDGLRCLRDRPSGEVDAVQDLALLVDRCLGCVEVLRLDAVVVEQPPRTEPDDISGDIADRPDQPTAEPVVRSARPGGDESGLE